MSTVAAQLYLYLLFPPFSEVFRIYDWYSLAPYYAHLQAALNGAAAVLLVCGRLTDWRANALLAVAFFALFVSGLLSAPFTFVFATPAYVASPPSHDPHQAAVAIRVGVEDCGARAVPDLHFFLRPARLLSRHGRHGRAHADGPDRMGPAAVGGILAAPVTRSLAMQRLAGCCCASTIVEAGC